MFPFCSLRLTFTRLYTRGIVPGTRRKKTLAFSFWVVLCGYVFRFNCVYVLHLKQRKRSKFHMFLQRGYERTSVSVILKAILYGSPHLLAPYTHETPTSSKKQINRSGSVPVKLSNICSQYSPDVWQNSKPTAIHSKHVSPESEIKAFHLL